MNKNELLLANDKLIIRRNNKLKTHIIYILIT